jgi:hypothetical protein
MVASQMLDQDRGFLYEGWIGVLIAEACLRCGEGGIGKAILGKRATCSGVMPSSSAAISQ